MSDLPLGPAAPDDDPAAEPRAAAAASAPRSVRASLASIVLGFELLVVFLAALVIWGLTPDDGGAFGLPRWAPLVAGGVVIVLMIATIGLLRHRWAYLLGWVVQALILLAGFLNPGMFFIGALFGGIWTYCMIVGERIDREKAAAVVASRTEQEHE
ncbi:DUF4233 domain-containing protein [Agromyces sp. Leaf222]|uniref:DUF4233 domain-containing protein n=1 Tax=Agromyces sp. Leaf222 TaxID=1735688 RepID=UPI0007008154|nr:DUF4233 domain-containing protein [Agromyces sp. Leaf222]KQM83406.1 hypothetical protein ASE68_09400 [Agromyces sp. Leaf222]